MVANSDVTPPSSHGWQGWLLLVVLTLLVLSGWHPYDRATWWMEIAPIPLALPVLRLTHKRFPLSTFLIFVIAIHAVILMVGGAYTYARVPLGHWVQEAWGLIRNPYDKLGHFMQGVTPALLTLEILLRRKALNAQGLAQFLAVCVALAFSALYELIEWWTALALGQGADAFLGSQGDIWDTQSDMFSALLGALCAAYLLRRWHQRSVAAGAPWPPLQMNDKGAIT